MRRQPEGLTRNSAVVSLRASTTTRLKRGAVADFHLSGHVSDGSRESTNPYSPSAAVTARSNCSRLGSGQSLGSDKPAHRVSVRFPHQSNPRTFQRRHRNSYQDLNVMHSSKLVVAVNQVAFDNFLCCLLAVINRGVQQRRVACSQDPRRSQVMLCFDEPILYELRFGVGHTEYLLDA